MTQDRIQLRRQHFILQPLFSLTLESGADITVPCEGPVIDPPLRRGQPSPLLLNPDGLPPPSDGRGVSPQAGMGSPCVLLGPPPDWVIRGPGDGLIPRQVPSGQASRSRGSAGVEVSGDQGQGSSALLMTQPVDGEPDGLGAPRKSRAVACLGRLPAPHVPGQRAQRAAAKVSAVQGRGLGGLPVGKRCAVPSPGLVCFGRALCPSGGPSCHRGLQPWCPPSWPAAVCPESAGVARGALLPSLGPEPLPGGGGHPQLLAQAGHSAGHLGPYPCMATCEAFPCHVLLLLGRPWSAPSPPDSRLRWNEAAVSTWSTLVTVGRPQGAGGPARGLEGHWGQPGAGEEGGVQGHRVSRARQPREGSQQVGHRDPPCASEQRLLEGFCR